MFRLIAQDGTQYPLERPVTVIGREGCDITLAGDESVSRQHAQVELRGDVLIVSDLGSSNGTFVNRTRLQSPRALRPGDVIRIGRTDLTVSGGEVVPAAATTYIGESTYAAPAPVYHPTSGKPGKVQTIAIMCLVDGILNIIWGISLAIALLTTIVCWPIGAYPIVLGILEIIYASKLLADPIKVNRPAQYLAIMQICNIALGDFISLSIGIVSLVFYNDPEVKDYFNRLAGGPPAYG